MEHLLKVHHIPYEIKLLADHGRHFAGLVQLDAVPNVARFFRKHFEKAA